ncbi:MAG: hypothetical protein JNM07_10545 [Phycisphaerae bacterium]|nr:hypothetical protein [Phycisphaerae bacterium]
MSPPSAETSRQSVRIAAWLGRPAAPVVALLGCLLIVSCVGVDPVWAGPLALLERLPRALVPPLLYLVAASGWGRPLTRWLLRPVPSANEPAQHADAPAPSFALQLAVGLAALLTLSHLAGWLGLLAGDMGRLVGPGLLVAGLVMLAVRPRGVRTDGAASRTPESGGSAWILLSAPAIATMLVAACSPPGWLWGSEFGGFDSLSYHLQLPQEWFRDGGVRAYPHNVYAYLPSYVEAAYLHLGSLTGLAWPSAPGQPSGLLANEGLGLASCQLLHAGMALLTAALIHDLVRAIQPRGPIAAARLAASAFLATPWVVVVGSLSYNEMAMTAMFAASLRVALDASGLIHAPARRGAALGLLIGAAVAAKPTSAFFVTPAVLLAAAAGTGRAGLTSLWRAAPAAASAVYVVSLPWLIRNHLAGGNPLFPAGAAVFGPAHWSPDQFVRFRAGHSFNGGLFERLSLLLSSERGAAHRQWFSLFPLALALTIPALLDRATRRHAAITLGGAALIALAWMFLTHLQSRFLLAAAVPLSTLVGLGAGAGNRSGSDPGRAMRAWTPLAALGVASLTAASLWVYSHERGGQPGLALAAGGAAFTGEAWRDRPGIESLRPEQRRDVLAGASPTVYCNLTLGGGDRLYLMGDSTPLYHLTPVQYHTTWDRPPIADPDPSRWRESLRSRGVSHVLVNLSEIARLTRDGWYDPSLTPERVSRWLDLEKNAIERAWPESGTVLVRLR